MKRETVGYQIAAVSRLTGLSTDTIRAWERRHGLVRPVRDEAGVRRYRKAEVLRLQRARQAIECGHSIRAIAAMSDEDLDTLLAARQAANLVSRTPAAQSIVADVLEATREYDAQRAKRAIRDATLLIEPRELVLDVFVPLMHEVGKLWSDGAVSIWQEHMLSEVVSSAMGALNSTHRTDERGGFLFATPPGELHSFGIAFAAILAATERFSVNNLGPNVPADEVIRAAAHLGAGGVVVGAPRSTQGARSARTFLAELERKLPERIDLWVGGPAEFAARGTTRAHHVATLSEFVELLAARR